MARTKLLNGQRVGLTPAEEARRDAEELAFANKVPVPPDPLRVYSRRDIAQALVDKGVLSVADLDAAREPKP